MRRQGFCHSARRLGHRVAARGPGAAAGNAGDRIFGYLVGKSDAFRLTGLRRGLNRTGYVEGRNLTIEYRWGGNQPDRLAALVAELIQMRVAVIVTPGLLSTLAAKAATTTIPILFGVGADPVRHGLVASLNRPGGNLTGFNQFGIELVAKGLALLHELVPSSTTIGYLGNPTNSIIDELVTTDVLAAAPAMGIRISNFESHHRAGNRRRLREPSSSANRGAARR